MSHVVTVKTQLNDLGLIKAALHFMGIEYKENGKVRMWAEATTKADLVIILPQYDIGIKKGADGNYMMECDNYAWGEISQHKAMAKYPNRGYGQEQFAGILTQATNIIKAQLIAASQGDELQLSEPDQNGVIHAQVIQA